MTVNETETEASSCPASRRRLPDPDPDEPDPDPLGQVGLVPNFKTQFNSNFNRGLSKVDAE